MPNLIISKVPSTSGSPGNLVIDKYVPPSYTESIIGEIYWRWEDEPTTYPQLIDFRKAGTSLPWTVDLAGRAIRLFLVSVTSAGVHSVTDIRLAEQMVFTPDPNIGIITNDGDVVVHEGNVVTYSG